MTSEEIPNVPETGANEDSEFKVPPRVIEKAEEEKLKAHSNNVRPITGHSAFLAKRLAKGQKYFDSGDYQMAKQKGPAKVPTSALNPATTAAAIPPPVAGQVGELHPTGDAIPTPESVPMRKTSIVIKPSKLTVCPASPAV